ncbi:pentatricopeptide repeat-containing protein At3g12770-like [Mercurialis annua]|uniref:pentatricopeptide repeat-containing protein At3g12770-like n=1 Tax=Mercurialis annua TaxID=3986 RepID=UPI00215E1A54|nr:pentatricopeptide repeat-containing protein At3g12770-like [Mercurialis annua]
MSANAIRTLSKKIEKIGSTILIRTNYHNLPFNCFLNSCNSLSHLKLIHALIITTGSHHSFLLSTKLLTLSSTLASSMDYARKLFDKMPQRDVFLWNTLIRGYADLGPCHEALLLYKSMHHDGFLPDNYTFPFVVRSCGVISGLKEGKEVHCNVIKNGFDLDVFVQSALVSMYAQFEEVLDMEIAFGEMVVRNIVSWTAMIAGYVQNRLFSEGLEIFREMVRSGTRPNAITLVSVLPACSSLEFLILGKLVYAYAVKVGVDSDVSLRNSFIAFYGKCGNVDVARLLFNGMADKSLVSWNAMLAAYEQNNAERKAIKLFLRMLCERVEYDYITVISVISACTSLGALGFGKWLHELIKRKGFETNALIMSALINMYAKCGCIELAKDIFEKLPDRNVVSWSSIIGACAYHGHAGDALKLFSQMKKEGIKPNGFTFTALLTACRHSGLVEEGRRVFESMTKDYSIVPCVKQCACVVDLLARAGCLIEAYEFVQNMRVAPDLDIWIALLSACKIYNNVELAELVAEKLFQLDPQNVNSYILMSCIYAQVERWEDAARLKNLIGERELKKPSGQSLVEANQGFHTFLAGLRSQPSWAIQ